MKRAASLYIVAYVVVLLPGCQSTTAPGIPEYPPILRALSANLVNDTFDICVGEEAVLKSVRFGLSSSWENVTAGPGTYDIVMTSPGAECAEGILLVNLIDIPLDAGTLSTIVISPDGASGYRLVDNLSPTPADRARVRVINASEDSISVSVTEVDGDDLFSQVRYNQTDDFGYTEIVAGTYSFTVTPQADETTGQLFEDFEFKTGFVYTLFVVGRVDGVDEGFSTSLYVDATAGVVERDSRSCRTNGDACEVQVGACGFPLGDYVVREDAGSECLPRLEMTNLSMLGGSLVLGRILQDLTGVGANNSIPLTCSDGIVTGTDVTWVGVPRQIVTLSVVDEETLNLSLSDSAGTLCDVFLRKP